MISIENFIENFYQINSNFKNLAPWEITNKLEEITSEIIQSLSNDYIINGSIAIHKNAIVGTGAILKGMLE